MAAGRQLGLLWGAVAALLVLLAPFAGPVTAALPDCPFRAITGVPCPACGSGGAALALSRLDLVGAFAASPLAALGWIALVGGGLVAGPAALRGHAVPEWPARMSGWSRAALALAVCANWGYVIATHQAVSEKVEGSTPVATNATTLSLRLPCANDPMADSATGPSVTGVSARLLG